MNIIDSLFSTLDARVGAEAEWQKIDRIAGTAGNEFEYQRLIAGFGPVSSPEFDPRTETGGKAGTWKYRNHEWYADQLP